MSTSADPPLDAVPLPAGVVLRRAAYDDPVAQQLIEAVQEEYVRRYGGRDGAVVDPQEFRPPHGLFLVALVDGRPAGCGGWRVHAPGVVELKRMYVDPAARRRGVAGAMLRALELTAARAGHRRMVLNSGERQPEALALYRLAGYTPVPGYGMYADSPEAVFLGRELAGEPSREGGGTTWES